MVRLFLNDVSGGKNPQNSAARGFLTISEFSKESQSPFDQNGAAASSLPCHGNETAFPLSATTSLETHSPRFGTINPTRSCWLEDTPDTFGEPLYIHTAAKFDLRKLSGDPGASGGCRARLRVSMTHEIALVELPAAGANLQSDALLLAQTSSRFNTTSANPLQDASSTADNPASAFISPVVSNCLATDGSSRICS